METAVHVLLAAAILALTFAVLRIRREHDKLRRKERATRDRLETVTVAGPSWMYARALIDGVRGYALARLYASGRPMRFAPKLCAQYGEDALLLAVFEDQETGYFVEAGATDGFHLSVTYVFEALGWTGCLVEALPDLARACVTRRPNSHVAAFALGRRGVEGRTAFTRATGNSWASDLSGLEVESLRGAELEKLGLDTEEIEVPITYLDDVLAKADAPRPIDFVVLDVEGTELDVLDGFDLESYAPRVCIVEDHDAAGDPALMALFDRAGYDDAGWLAINHVFVRRDEPVLFDRAFAYLKGM